jgi:hypothetical protein
MFHYCADEMNPVNVVVERLNPLLYMREVQISTLGPDVVYPD